MELPKDRRGWLKLFGALVLAFAAYQVVKRLLPDIDAQQVLDDVSGSLGAWTYLIVAVLAFLETGAFVGLIAPGETFVVLAGAVAGQGETNVVLTIGIVWLSAFLGDTVSYLLGVKLGRGWVLKHGEKLRITRERFAQVESYFDRHGGKTILIGRFIGLVRALAPFIAGSSGMAYRAMAPYSILGTGLWATTFTLLGYFASKNIEAVLSNSEHALVAFALIAGVIVAGALLVRFMRVPANRSKVAAWMDARPGFRTLIGAARRLQPQARFVAGRLTPGDLGLELTTAFAALAVGSYVFVAYALFLGDNPGPTPTDTAARDIAESIRAGWLTTLAKVITFFGTSVAVGVASLITATWMAYRRHWMELAILAFGFATIMVAPDIAKEAVDRPRPDGGLVDAAGQGYPSAHATHAVVYAWIAIVVSLRSRAGVTQGAALVVAGILAAVAIGLSRVYLGVHYMSDVNGGWALGVSLFALIATIALLVAYFRQDGRRDVA